MRKRRDLVNSPMPGWIWEGAWDMGYRPRCGWRHRLAGRARNQVLRKCLAAALILEGSFGAGQLFFGHLREIPVIRLEEGEALEWFIPKEGENERFHEVFGIQFRFEDGEVRIYRTREEIRSH